MRVLKFGGSSVGTPEAVRQLTQILKGGDRRGKVACVVVSALGGVTDALIAVARKAASGDSHYIEDIAALRRRHQDMAEAFLNGAPLKTIETTVDGLFGELNRVLDGVSILGELSARSLDLITGFGERLSANLIAASLTAQGLPAEFFDAREIIKTDDHFGGAAWLPNETFTLVKKRFAAVDGSGPLPIMTGFIASTTDRIPTTLGRGGSDLSAAILGAALGAEEVEIWTDVDGILSADPRQVREAFRIEQISYEEAMELSHFGAKVIYPPTILPALEKSIPIRILNTFNPTCPGTLIVKEAPDGPYPIRGVTSMHKVALVRVQGSAMAGVAGFSSRLFGALARKGINIILISQSSSEYSICFAVLPQDADAAGKAAREEFDREIAGGSIDPPIVDKDLSIIAVVGSNMRRTPGVSGKVFHALGRNGISIVAIAQGSSEINISAVVNAQNEGKAVNAIHEAFFLSGVRSVNLFLMGVGLIGGTLLEQLAEHQEILAEEYKIRIRVTGAANSHRMIFCREGLEPRRVRAMLKGEDTSLPDGCGIEPLDLRTYITRMQQMNLPNSCFCDCTASDAVAACYADVLRSLIPVVTPNKRANAGSLDYYRTLRGFSRARGIPYLYETTVCAGLPVISTLRDLFLSGDKVRRIEAVLSGTLSYIFNNFDGSKPFSALVSEAKAKGYTEPDPREDLNAMDAARKALILARECGLSLEFSNVEIEPILPPACFAAPDVESFFTELAKSDAVFEEKRAKAAAEGQVLRYIATVSADGGHATASLSLRAEDPASPFRSLTDADNIVVITSDRYSTLPMVIKGPGAGAQVTAGGVFADIVRIARTLV
jgi:aspartokinase/homoserine dehydrogenase 1